MFVIIISSKMTKCDISKVFQSEGQESKNLVVFIVCIALLVDSMLLTVIGE